MDYHPFEAHHFTLIIKNIGIEVVTMSKIAFTGGGTVGHVSVNLSLIPTAVKKVMKRFISVLNKELKER